MRRAVCSVGLAALVVAAVAACGSSSSSSSKSTSSGSSATSGAGQTSAAAQAAKAVAMLEKRPTSLTVPALPSKPKKGGRIDYVYCGLPVCQAFGQFVQQAAAAAGWQVKEINAGLTPQTVSAAYDQTVVDHPDGVIGSGGFPPSLFTHQLAELAADKIPVVLAAVGPAPNVTAELGGPSFITADGRELADYILADSKGHNAHVAIFTTPATPIYAGLHAAIKSAMSSPSCDGCSVTVYSFPETDIGSKLPGEVTSFLDTHQNVNYLVFDFSNEVDGVPAALATAGQSGKVKILTTDTTSTESEYLKRGQETAAAAVPWPEFFWGGVGIILAHSEGASLTAYENISYPHMLLTGSNLVTTSGLFPLVADYQAVFKKAWHVG